MMSEGECRMINVRMATASDMDSVKDFIRDIFPDAMVQINDDDIVLLAEYTGDLVGFAHIIDEGDRAILQGIGVEDSVRSHGVGTMLLEHTLMAFEGMKPIYLKVKAMNPAIDLYMRYGFMVKKFGERTHVLVKKPDS